MKRRLLASLFVLFLPVILILLTGCLKVPSASLDFGPSSSSQDVEQALGKLESSSALQVRKGDFVYLETSLRVESLMPEVIRQQAYTVLQRNETTDSITLNVARRLNELSGGQFKTSVTEEVVTLQKGTSPTSAQTLAAIAAQPSGESTLSVLSGPVFVNGLPRLILSSDQRVQSQARRVTYHNLKVDRMKISVPLLVQMQDNCGGLGLGPCEQGLASVRVSVDQVVWENGQPTKTSYSWLSSLDSPPLASQLSACAQALMPFQGAMVNMVQCEDVKNFTRAP
ncbi:MAG: hypothetical protein WCH11_06220 [Bdellovibrio sp.]